MLDTRHKKVSHNGLTEYWKYETRYKATENIILR